MSAPSVTVFNSIPVMYIKPMQMAQHTGTLVEATKAVRSGKRSSITKITTMIEIRISRRNDITESSTTLG